MKKLNLFFICLGIFTTLSGQCDEYLRKDVVEELITRAKVWFPTNPEEKDFIVGPVSPSGYSFKEVVTCRYNDGKMGGTTPKFLCIDQKNGQTIKVKYRREVKEVYGEILGSRLFWALGFGYDNNYAAIVHCLDCPEKVAKHGTKLAGTNITVFEPATIELRNNKNEIEFKQDSGWRWDYDLLRVDPRKGGAIRAEVDALRLLGVFIYHWDNKAANQRIVCLDESVTDLAQCQVPYLMVHDHGSTFGGYFNITRLDIYSNAVSLRDWKKEKIWKSKDRCEIGGRSSYPKISEAGRALLADLMARLSEQQIIDLFNAARIELLGEEIVDNGHKRIANAHDWARVFIAKRKEIVDHQCPQ